MTMPSHSQTCASVCPGGQLSEATYQLGMTSVRATTCSRALKGARSTAPGRSGPNEAVGVNRCRSPLM